LDGGNPCVEKSLVIYPFFYAGISRQVPRAIPCRTQMGGLSGGLRHTIGPATTTIYPLIWKVKLIRYVKCVNVCDYLLVVIFLGVGK
jgi:hypothetical protein